MTDTIMEPQVPATAGLSQIERVIDTFIAPSKTFTDIRRCASWWLPFLLTVIVGVGFVATVQSKVGWGQIYTNTMRENPSGMARMSQMTAQQQTAAQEMGTKGMEYGSYAYPILGLIFAAIVAGVLLGSLKFGFGGKGTFSQFFAVYYYATLPMLIKFILVIITLFAGLDPTTFNIKNPIGTCLSYYLPLDSAHWLLALGNAFDIFYIWSAILFIIGCAKVAGVKKSSAATVVLGWWILWTLISMGAAAIG